jgi:hypothetical protein
MSAVQSHPTKKDVWHCHWPTACQVAARKEGWDLIETSEESTSVPHFDQTTTHEDWVFLPHVTDTLYPNSSHSRQQRTRARPPPSPGGSCADTGSEAKPCASKRKTPRGRAAGASSKQSSSSSVLRSRNANVQRTLEILKKSGQPISSAVEEEQLLVRAQVIASGAAVDSRLSRKVERMLGGSAAAAASSSSQALAI